MSVRIRTEIRGGAWCPNGLITPQSRQYLEVDLHDEYLITATETQGRFANSVGVEFVESYSIEYWRNSLMRWVKYKDFNGSRVTVSPILYFIRVKRRSGSRLAITWNIYRLDIAILWKSQEYI